MADNVTANQGSGGPVFKTDEVAGVHTPISKIAYGEDGVIIVVDEENPLPVSVASTVVSGEVALDSATLAALETVQIGNFPEVQTVDGSVSVSNFPATQPVSGSVSVSNFPASQPVTGTFWQAVQPVSGPLTDSQLRASAVQVSGIFYQDTQPVSASSLPLPTGAATEATLSSMLGAFKEEDASHNSGDRGIPFLGIRSTSDTVTADADGDYTLLKIDEEGRLKVATKPASYPDITGDINAVQASASTPVAGGAVEGDVSRASNVMAFCTGTFSGVSCVFEGSLEPSGDTAWFTIQAARSNANTVETSTGTLSAQPSYAWEMSVNGLKRVRVRCTARTSGTQSWRFVLGTYATEPIPALQSHSVSGTVAVTIAPAIYTDTTTNLGAGATFTGSSRDGGSTALYRWFYAIAYANQDGTFRIERSTDNTNWFPAISPASLTGGGVVTLQVPVTARYHRVVYVNGGVAQTSFQITSGYGRV